MMRQTNFFAQLPIDVVQKILSNLNPSTIRSLFFFNKQFNKAINSKLFWLEKFILHFPHVFESVLKKHNVPFGPIKLIEINWPFEFLLTEKNEYKNLTKEEIDFFFRIKEGNYESFYHDDKKLITIPLRMLDLKDKDAISVVSWVYIFLKNIAQQKFQKKCSDLEFNYEYLAQEEKNEAIKKHIEQELETLRKVKKINLNANHHWAGSLRYQYILDCFYQSKKNFYENYPPMIDSQNRTLLYFAVLYNQSKETIESLLPLTLGCKLEFVTTSDEHPIHLACQMGRLDLLELFLAKQSNLLNITNGWGYTPLMCAAREGHIPIVTFLLNKGKALNLESFTIHMDCPHRKKNALHLAVENGHTEIVEMLLNAGMEAYKCADNNLIPIHYAAREGHTEVVELLLKKYPDQLNVPDLYGQSPFLWACTKGHLRLVNFFLDFTDLDLNNHTQNFGPLGDKNHSLHYATKNFHIAVMLALMKAGMDVISPYGDPSSNLIHFVTYKNNLQGLKLIIERHPELIFSLNESKRTPLMIAAMHGHLNIVEYLISVAKDQGKLDLILQAKDRCNETALHLAHLLKDIPQDRVTKIVIILLKAGIDTTVKSHEGYKLQTIHLAAKRGFLGSVKAHIEHDLTLLNQPDDHGYTPLMYAAANKYIEIVEYLLSNNGIDINSKTYNFKKNDEHRNNKTALHLAAENGCSEIVFLLLQKNPEIDPEKPIIKRSLSPEALDKLEQYESDQVIMNACRRGP